MSTSSGFSVNKKGFTTFSFHERGFTLVELLVVITIIAILSVIGLTVFSSAQGIARDSKRKADLDAIYKALEIYYYRNGRYPSASDSCYENGGNGNFCYVYSIAGGNWIPGLVPDFMIQVPVDPINNASGPWSLASNNYSYAYGNVPSNGRTYDLTARLENTSDPARCGVMNYKGGWWNNSWCEAFGGPYSNQIYEKSPLAP